MEELISRFSAANADLTSLLARLAAEVRPADPDDVETARRNLQALSLQADREASVGTS